MAANSFVLTVTHLEGRPNASHALDLMKKAVSLVRPIMRKHGWILPKLGEFFPDDPNLLGEYVNRGKEILIRLRPHHSPTWFFEMEDIIGTLLHELAHNVHGPHDERFYKFLNELQEEYYALQRTGYAGEGFHSSGYRLGGPASGTSNTPPHKARQKAAEAALNRKQVSEVLGGGVRHRTLGGLAAGTLSSTRNLSPRELAARAAERRLRDAKYCGSQQRPETAGTGSSKSKASPNGATSEAIFIDLTADDDDEDDKPLKQTLVAAEADDDIVIVKDIHPRAVSAPFAKVQSGLSRVRGSGPKRKVT
ncbi:WLM domain-containing protein [Coprinopsis sp. MPI-PUGE-AT-0042]|nr:WLM domain-containing protein [Coprinopsis sp. MPI-PUGE-AT-0042]